MLNSSSICSKILIDFFGTFCTNNNTISKRHNNCKGVMSTYHPRALQTWNRYGVHSREDRQGRVEVVLFNARSRDVEEMRDCLRSLFGISAAQNKRLNPSSQLYYMLATTRPKLQYYNLQYWNELSSSQSWHHWSDPRKTTQLELISISRIPLNLSSPYSSTHEEWSPWTTDGPEHSKNLQSCVRQWWGYQS